MQCIEISKVKRNNQHWRNSIIPLPYVNSLNPQQEIEKLLCVVGLLPLLFESVITLQLLLHQGGGGGCDVFVYCIVGCLSTI